MALQWTPYLIPSFIVAVGAFIAALYVLRKRGRQVRARVGALLLFAISWWLLCASLETASTELRGKQFWVTAQYVSICTVPTLWFVYVLFYTGREKWLTMFSWVLLTIVPLTTFILVLTNPSHGLIWRAVVSGASVARVAYRATYSVGGWAYQIYAYVLVIIGLLFVLQALVRSGQLLRWQAIAVTMTAAIPLLVHITQDSIGILPLKSTNLTPFVLAITGSVLAWSFSRLRGRDIVPVARGQVIEGLADAILVLDSDDRVLDLNPAAERLFGQTRRAAFGQPIDLVWPRQSEHLPPRPDDGAGYRGVVSTPKQQRSYDVLASVLVDPRGGQLGRVITLRDITDLKETEAALAQSEQYAQHLVENAHDLVMILEQDGVIRYTSPAVQRILGYTPAERIGHNAFELIPPEDQLAVIATFRESLTHGVTARTVEARVRHRDGSFRVLEIAGTNLLHDPVIGGILLNTRDITDRKRAEMELVRYAAELESSNQELQQFAYVASHDLQEPLRMITSYLRLLEQRYAGKLDSDADEFIGFAVEGAARMSALLKGLLTYSRVNTGGMSFRSTDSQEVVEHVLANLGLAIEESSAAITCEPLPILWADPIQLGQLFQNLIGNAIKFRNARPPRIYIGAERRDSGWVFSVRDEGIGIDPQYASRIFTIFQRLNTRETYPGTGIGLAICKRIVQRHGGHIWVESELGKGATFYFTIPTNRQSELSDGNPARAGRSDLTKQEVEHAD